ncbi:MAG: hypothetical protein WB507_11940 [Solirubrobacterales bacterium]
MEAKRKTPTLLRNEVIARLEDLPLQLLALQSAMEEFGQDFELAEFKPAFERKSGIKAYNKVQAVERAFSRVQNYVVELAEYGSKLAQLELPKSHQSDAARAFDALKAEGVISATLCNHLKRAQKARAAIEHDYVAVKSGRLHEAVKLVLPAAQDFIGPFSAWIEAYLK